MNSEIAELANRLRDLSDDFTGEDSPEEVVQAVLEAQIAEIEEHEQELAEKRASLKADLTGQPAQLEETEPADETSDEIARRQSELKRDITGGN